MTPKHDAAGIFEIRRGNRASEGISVRVIFMPIADFSSVGEIRTAECIHKAIDPINVVRNWRAARRRQTEGDGFGSGFPANAVELRCGLLECFVPRNPVPAGVVRAFWVRAPQWIELALRIVDDFSGSPPFDAERLAGWMFR